MRGRVGECSIPIAPFMALLAVVLSALFGASAAPVAAQVVRGTVSAAGSGEPIGDAQLVLRNGLGVPVATAVSESSGRFVLSLRAPGTVTLEVSHLGYASWETAPFDLGRDQLLEVEVRLGVEAIPLEPITVVAESTMQLGTVAGFRERMSDPTLSGYFLLEDEIERRPMAKPSDLVLGAPGMSIGLANSAAGLDRGVIMAGGCPARTFIDGMRVQQGAGASVDDLISPDRIAGVEIYPRPAGAPLQYQDPGQRCGVVLFWTKPAEQDADGGSSRTRILLGIGLLVGILTVGIIG